jgi:hypothetical protein
VKYIVARMAEPSTWRGIVFMLTSIGITIQPELVGPIIAIGTGVAGLIGVLTKDKAPAPEPQRLAVRPDEWTGA